MSQLGQQGAGGVINPNVQAAIQEMITEGSKKEFGFLDILTNESVGTINPLMMPNVEIHGDQLWVRKYGMQLGGEGADIFKNNYYSDNTNTIQKIDMLNEFTIRFYVDIKVLNALGDTYTGADLKSQLIALVHRGTRLSYIAKFDAVHFALLNSSANAKQIGIDLNGIKTSAATFDILFGKLLSTHINIAFTVSDLQSSINSFKLGTNIADYMGFVQPVWNNLTNIWRKGFASGEGSQNAIIANGANENELYGVKYKGHPFFNQFVNHKTTDWTHVDRSITIFDGSTDYDFTGLVGLIAHKEAALVPVRYNAFTFNQDPFTQNYIGVLRVGYGTGLVRDELIVKLIDTSTPSGVFAQDVQNLLAKYQLVANAVTVPSGQPIASVLQAALVAETAATYPTVDLVNIKVTASSPSTAATVTVPTAFTYTITIPSKTALVTPYQSSTNTAYYKNS